MHAPAGLRVALVVEHDFNLENQDAHDDALDDRDRRVHDHDREAARRRQRRRKWRR